MADTMLQVPQISQAEMIAFREAHFSKLAADHFHAHFLPPDRPQPQDLPSNVTDKGEYSEEEDDGLGYYPDGVKRTLTDEQIAIFRHSELEALRRARESSTATNNTKEDAVHDLSEGEVSSPTPTAAASAKKAKKRKRGKAKNNTSTNKHGGEPIDLRKRTWDVVDTGLATLDYGEEHNEPVEARAIQRRHISYDDD
ncbi:hypothetical protein C8A05DRAFT_43876 [Staphylotrichum tortipilum]|uniref:Uncharacterized protein n=1 Tax=Staphylotrichum tortipilum TaxID=2831512 RepID=A0AAN6RTT1_9PEZI|nr:hypothetical protein C8A05DRAFT_43876 [Staphylotrichum longicolle]